MSTTGRVPALEPQPPMCVFVFRRPAFRRRAFRRTGRGDQAPGTRYGTLFSIASSTVSGVISTVIFTLRAPAAPMFMDTAAAVASSGKSAIRYASQSPNA